MSGGGEEEGRTGKELFPTIGGKERSGYPGDSGTAGARGGDGTTREGIPKAGEPEGRECPWCGPCRITLRKRAFFYGEYRSRRFARDNLSLPCAPLGNRHDGSEGPRL